MTDQRAPRISAVKGVAVPTDSLGGEDMGKFLLVGELAVGGMAEVFLALQRGPEGFLKVVVVKRVLPHLVTRPDIIDMFGDEARLAARLEHPNIVRTYEFGASEGQYYTVMEYLIGEDLSSVRRFTRISKEQLPIPVVAYIIGEVCKGLHFAHELTDADGNSLGVVHRDISPSNILITYGGEVKIIDFGVAKTTINIAKTVTGTIKGKLSYMAPEQITASEIDRRVDVFSTGIVLWQLLTGTALFKRKSDAATMYAVMSEAVPAPSTLREDIPAALDEIVLKALARNADDRYATMDELRLALDAFVKTLPAMDPAPWIAKAMDVLFGHERHEAKKGISQLRSLEQNLKVVMTLRRDSRPRVDPDAPTIAIGSSTGVTSAAPEIKVVLGDPSTIAVVSLPTPPKAPFPIAKLLVVLVLLAGAGVGAYMVFGRDSEKPAVKERVAAIVKIESNPAGAAVSVGGEPTGLLTPATLSDVAAGPVTIRLELHGYRALENTIDAIAGQTVQRTFTLQRADGLLSITGLPERAELIIDDATRPSGESVTLSAGTHQVRVVVDGATLVSETIEITEGEQTWKLDGKRMVRE